MPLREWLRPNEIVAYNLARARRLRGWTQEEAAHRLEQHLGVRWSKAVFSAAERSIGGVRVREFTADEIVAFARAFELPVMWFFLPPGADADRGEGALPLTSAMKDGPKDVEDTLTPDELLRLIWNQDLPALIRETADRIDSYEPGVEAAQARGMAVDHLSGWTRALIADALSRKSGNLRLLDRVIQNLALQLAALKADLESRQEGQEEGGL